MEQIPRLSGKEALILELLINKGQAYGLEMISASEGKLKRGTIYVTLSRMEEKGYVESWKEPAQEGQQGPPRRLYHATGHGARVFNVWRRMLEAWHDPQSQLIPQPKLGLGGAM